MSERETIKIRVRGHESFALRRGWLHKGIRSVENKDNFFSRSNENPCDVLGIGANMVSSLRYWLKATQLITDKNGAQKLTSSAQIINQNDTYFEELGTTLIVHYLLASNRDEATAWYWLFNEYRGDTIDKKCFIEEFGEYCQTEGGMETPPKGLDTEFSILMRSYNVRDEENKILDPEETKVCPFTELHLLSQVDSKQKDKEYKKTMPDKDSIHPYIAFAIISKRQKELKTKQIQISDLLSGKNNIGRIFNLDRSTVFYIIEKLERKGLIEIIRTAGLDVINIKRKMTFDECITEYYNQLHVEGVQL